MKYFRIMVLLAATLIFSGCFTLSLFPLGDEKTIQYDEKLIGIWGNPGLDSETWQFEEGVDKSYKLTIREEGTIPDNPDNPGAGYKINSMVDAMQDGVFKVTMVKLGGYYFLNLFPEEPEIGNDLFKSHVIPAYSFYRVELYDDSLTVYSFDTQWFEKEFENGNIEIGHFERNGIQIISANTADLQKFVLNHIKDAFDYSDPAKVQRLK